MTLTLTIIGATQLENGEPATIALDRHGAVIGRSPHADWSLPDPRKLISSSHCEISYRDGQYLLTDQSTNGTYLNQSGERLRDTHTLTHGDSFSVGHYVIAVSQVGKAADAATPPVSADADTWGSFPATGTPLGSREDEGWAEPPDLPSETGDHWRRAAPPPPTAPVASTWDLPAPIARPSAWSSEPRQITGASADDVWGRLAEQSEIDWSRGNFAALAPSDEQRPFAASQAKVAPPGPDAEWQGEAIDQPGEPDPQPAAAVERAEAVATGGDAWSEFIKASGVPGDRLNRSPTEVLVAAGAILRQLVGGLMLMIEARARAKAQLGVQATALELDGNNPLKFVRSPERALLQLLGRTERGFMPAERAVEDAYQDLQAHQMATLSAMRGALEGTLSRFSPRAIRDRVTEPTGLARWFPALHRAKQWDVYERDFEGVVRGADDAFMDLFAKEFRLHYDRHIGDMKQRRREGGSR